MIKPTLFVGLGTTGTKIIKSLRQLMFEEYGHAGLPVFRYIAIETDGGENGEDPELRLTNQMQDFERIELISATIQNTAPIYNKINRNHRQYNPHLADWLNPELLKVETHSFETGAKNIRMAGRLCLWENWVDMQQKVESAHDAIIAQDTTEKAQDLLKQYYQTKGRQEPQDQLIDDGAINVYIVGSLCGGSCSGMLIDIAYFFRSLLAGQDGSNVYGMFTMYDRQQATGQNIDRVVRAANCYASLLELNYYNHTDTTYNITFPTGHRVDNMRRKPFDYATFVSRSSRTGTIKHVLPNGGFDEDGLNLMVALNLFSETAGDTDGEKAAIRTDWDGYEGVWGLKDPAIKGDISFMVKFMASFGLTAVWYPKYRIATASASLVSKSLSNILLGKHVPRATVLTDAANEWQTIFNSNIDVLTTPEGQSPLRSRIQSELNRVISSPNVSKQDAFSKKFEEGGDYHGLIKIQIPYCENAYRNALEQVLNNQLGVIDFQSKTGLEDVITFFEALDEEIEKTIQTLPDRLPPFNLRLNLTPTKSIRNSLWTKLLGLQKSAVEGSRNELVDEYREAVLGDRESAYQTMRNHFLREVLEKVRAELGFGVQPSNPEEVNPAGTIRQRLEDIRSSLNACIQAFQNGYENAIKLRNYASVKIVTDDPQNKIEIDAKALSAEILKMNTLSQLLGKQSMSAFLTQGYMGIANRMIETYQRLSLEQIPVKDVVTKARNILDVGGSDNEIITMANRSNPYQTFNNNYVADALPTLPKIICGDNANRDALNNLRNNLSSRGHEYHFPRLGGSSVDHILFFYEEEAGFALDDLDAHTILEENFLKDRGTYGHLTHQDPDKIDLGLHQKRAKLETWCEALVHLAPQFNSDVFEGVLRLDNGRYVYEYYIDGLIQTLGLQDDIAGIKKLARAETTHAYRKFIAAIQDIFGQLGRPEVLKVVNQLLVSVMDLNQRQQWGNFFGNFLDEVFSINESPSGTDEESKPKLDPSVFQMPPRTYQQTSTSQPENTPTSPNQEIDNDNAIQSTAEAGPHDITVPEEGESDIGIFNQTDMERNEETPQDTSQDDASDTNDGEDVPIEVEAEKEPGLAEDTVSEDSSAEQQPQSETGEQEKQPSREFSVTNSNVKQTLQGKGTRKKE